MNTNANTSGYNTTHPSGTRPKAPNSLPGTPNAGAQPTTFAPGAAQPPTPVTVKEANELPAVPQPGFLDDLTSYFRQKRLVDAGKLSGASPSAETLQRYADTRGRVMKGTAQRVGVGLAGVAGAAGVYGLGRAIANRMSHAQPAPQPHDTESMGPG